MTAITTAELLDAIRTAAKGQREAPGFATLADISEQSGISKRLVVDALHTFHRKGQLQTTRVVRTGIDGRRTSIPAYRIITKGKKP